MTSRLSWHRLRTWRALAVYDDHRCGIQTDGSLWCWGINSFGQVGDVASVPLVAREPVQVGEETDWTHIEVGLNHTCGIREGGSTWCWGVGFGGLLGHGQEFDWLENSVWP